jgi:hypothetical protein
LDGGVDKTSGLGSNLFTVPCPDVEEMALLASGTGMGISIGSTVFDSLLDFQTLILFQIKTFSTLDARVLPMISQTGFDLESIRNLRAAFANVVQEKPRETEMTRKT